MVTSVEVTGGNDADYPQFAPLVAETAKHVKVRRVSADKAYSGTFNVAYVATLGAVPLLPFKANATGGDGPMTIWRRLFHVYSFQRDTFLAHYHKRSNVETTFSMMKAKFGDGLRSKSEVAQCNEAFLKEPCHNICCVIQST
ncbi:MAG: transposase, partial [Chloroflexota bacterium]